MFKELVEKFWTDFFKCKTTQNYVDLLENAEVELFHILDTVFGEEDYRVETPLLAMVSEVHYVCPGAVHQLAEKNTLISSALDMLHGFNEYDRKKIAAETLNKPSNNVVQIDFTLKKRKE